MAKKGKQEGEGDWHLMPDDIRHLADEDTVRNTDNDPVYKPCRKSGPVSLCRCAAPHPLCSERRMEVLGRATPRAGPRVHQGEEGDRDVLHFRVCHRRQTRAEPPTETANSPPGGHHCY